MLFALGSYSDMYVKHLFTELSLVKKNGLGKCLSWITSYDNCPQETAVQTFLTIESNPYYLLGNAEKRVTFVLSPKTSV